MTSPKAVGVFWAEDSPDDQFLIRSALEDHPAPPPVTFASDGQELLALLARRKPSLVVLDLKMPRLGGLETLRRMRNAPATASLPVIVFSAGEQPKETAACRALGALDVVGKPVEFESYAAAVHRIVSHVAPTVAVRKR